ncbi:hypothetical protein AB4Y90_14090 [Chryseobacterium sp. 2TAF14]|uniref:hypothetical protein n=1 Tax=Chryseobacterium sp. 2TAF14 TaxID=3233007 RepID=UPI003F920145
MKTFFVFSLLLIFLSNVSGTTQCLEHARHSVTKTAYKKDFKGENSKTISQDDECQCNLHLHMNASVLPEIQNLDFVFHTLNNSEIPQPKAKTYCCLLDYFSSRAPPGLS